MKEINAGIAAAGVASKAQQDAARKRAEKQEEIASNKLAFAMQANETPEERRRREKMLVEEDAISLSADLLGSGGGSSKSNTAGGMVSGIASVQLKNKQDHVNFAVTVSAKLSESTGFNIAAFFKELTERVKNDLPLEQLSEIVTSLTAVRDEKKKKKAVPVAKVSSKEVKKKKQQHEDTFGGGYDDFDDDHGYGQLEEDYLF